MCWRAENHARQHPTRQIQSTLQPPATKHPAASAASTLRLNVSTIQPPHFLPRLAIVIRLQRDDAVQREEGASATSSAADPEDAGNDRRSSGRAFRGAGGRASTRAGRRAADRASRRTPPAHCRPPEALGRLPRAQFSAVPDDGPADAAPRRSRRQAFDLPRVPPATAAAADRPPDRPRRRDGREIITLRIRHRAA